MLGVQVNQPIRILNSDPTTHNIHPTPRNNREWNESMASRDTAQDEKVSSPRGHDPGQVQRSPLDEELYRRSAAPVLLSDR